MEHFHSNNCSILLDFPSMLFGILCFFLEVTLIHCTMKVIDADNKCIFAFIGCLFLHKHLTWGQVYCLANKGNIMQIYFSENVFEDNSLNYIRGTRKLKWHGTCLRQGCCKVVATNGVWGIGLFLGTAERVNVLYCSQDLKVKGFEFYVNNEWEKLYLLTRRHMLWLHCFLNRSGKFRYEVCLSGLRSWRGSVKSCRRVTVRHW
jgi:hypothetical protein